MSSPWRTPTATYRLQFSSRFTFRDAESLVGYLSDLGVSHVYASPYLKARAGSPHGYDITDYNALNPEIGDAQDLDALTTALHARGMGQILDFVPNHMGVARADNPWWLDVLEWGRASPYADYFDIDWFPAKRELRGKVLLPFLGDHYGRVLESGGLTLAFDTESGGIGVWYHEHLFPICPAHYAVILAPGIAQAHADGICEAQDLESLDEIVKQFRALRPTAPSIRRRVSAREQGVRLKQSLAELARSRRVRALIDLAIGHFAGVPGEERAFLPLHRLLERQAYRLAYWRVAADEINYRRFFDINDLAGVKMERHDLFEAAHAMLFRWIGEGKLDGVRIDHVDGLFDPVQYCRRLATRMAGVRASADRQRSTESSEDPAESRESDSAPTYVIVEKILARHESLRHGWPVHGTTGYETLNLINGLFVRPEDEPILNRAYRRFSGRSDDFDEILYQSKKYIMEHALSSELQVLANDLDRICESNWRTRDFTMARLRAVLEEVAACFPVYRTYVDEGGAAAEDRQNIDWAISRARRRSADPESTIFDFVHDVLTTDLVRQNRPGYSRRDVIRFAKKFQQFTSPVTAKALEDTSFYRFVRLISLNEVGGDPRRFGVTISAFHHLNQERARHWPFAMVSTGTHDCKRGEDARARLNVLSEMPEEWGRQVRRWATLNRWARPRHVEDNPPSRNDEYFLYQTLLGSWPNDLLDPTRFEPRRVDAYRERVAACLIKAVREAKLRSSWLNPNAAYEEAVREFIARIFDPVRSAKFLSAFTDFLRQVRWFGMLNSLSQTLLKLTVPGVPDIYQGAEFWDYTMVDPDNRRPVDFSKRAECLENLRAQFQGSGRRDTSALHEMLQAWPDGRIKLFLIHQLLSLRLKQDELFLNGDYVPFDVRGERADQLCVFARALDRSALVVVAPRFFVTVAAAGTLPVGGCWGDTVIAIPPALQSRTWTDALTHASRGGGRNESKGEFLARNVLADLPVAALLSD